MNACYVREEFAPEDSPATAEERLTKFGVEGLRDGELLALLLEMDEWDIQEKLGQTTVAQIFNSAIQQLEDSFGKRKGIVLHSALELCKRVLNKGLGIVPAISCPSDALPYVSSLREKDKEHFHCLFLNARNQVIHQETISIGSLSASLVHPRELFHIAIERLCASVILTHNHPSGDPNPSKDDLELTRRLAKAGELLGIDVLDHIIVARDDFISLKEKGIMPEKDYPF